jgi:hypothetical protein
MAIECGVSFGVCVARVTKVDAAGNVVAGSNSYVTDAISQITLNPNKETGESIVVRNGCGCAIARKKFPDTFNWWDLTFNGAKLEPAMEALLLGAETITDAGNVVGLAFPSTLDCNDTEPAVAIEWWSENQVGSGQDGTYPWIHFVIPKAVFSKGDETFARAALENPFVGFSQTNTQWGDGPYGDGPPDGQDLREGGWWLTADDPPTANCALANVTATS